VINALEQHFLIVAERQDCIITVLSYTVKQIYYHAINVNYIASALHASDLFKLMYACVFMFQTEAIKLPEVHWGNTPGNNANTARETKFAGVQIDNDSAFHK